MSKREKVETVKRDTEDAMTRLYRLLGLSPDVQLWTVLRAAGDEIGELRARREDSRGRGNAECGNVETLDP